jgi:hypothetical protein
MPENAEPIRFKSFNRPVHLESKKLSKSQTVISLFILAVLSVVLAGILYTQFDFNPAVAQWQQLAAGEAELGPSGAAPPQATLIAVPEQLVGLTPPEVFDRQTLSDKINGKAELYLSSGFERLEAQRFSLSGTTQPWMELFSYNMGRFENAYSVFSVQRREGAAPVDLVEYAYQTENALFLVHGPYYLEIIASAATEQMLESMLLLAGIFIEQVKVVEESIKEDQLFPPEGLLADSIARIPTNAFGYERMDKVFTAQYQFDGTEIGAYFSRRESEAEAAELAAAYREFLVRFGGKNLGIEMPIENAAVIHILDTHEIVFSMGPYLAGVREAENLQQALTLAMRLHEHLKMVGEK